jgi:N-methylhydantoinase A/oxoprolinase/acetone carboxylase beta subunit
MQFSLGIDAGGTYTDAILVRNSDSSIVSSSKALTTYPDLISGIKNAIDGLKQEHIEKVSLVSVSTTLATNTVLEGTGSPVALILVGEHPIKGDFPAKHTVLVDGGHSFNGEEVLPLDVQRIRNFALKVKNEVAAFAVSAFFSIRNPEHEIVIRTLVHELTGMPVVCGHELSQELGAYERAVTAALNAQLLPISNHFIKSVMDEIKRRNINAKLLMLKCDGTVVGLKEALEKPVESIFSGPAASLVGASYLSGCDTCAVIDVGGTSTDVSAVYGGFPELTDAGAMVGGWRTRVRATRMETSAMGGDSHVWTRSKRIFIGPRRVIPLCIAAALYPSFLEKLQKSVTPPRHMLDWNVQPTKFFMRSGFKASDLNESETAVLDVLSDEPMSLDEIISLSQRYPSSVVLDSLIQKRLIQPVGFTPTDALHVLGDYVHWNAEASALGAEKLGRMNKMNKSEFSSRVKNMVAKNMAFNLMSFLLPDVERSGVKRIVDGQFPARFKVDVPVVLLGGPVRALTQELASVIDADIIVPDYAEVGNAAGALFGKGIKRIEFIIRMISVAEPDAGFYTFSPLGRGEFRTYSEAVNSSKELGKKMVTEYMGDCGVSKENLDLEVTHMSYSPEGWKYDPLETKLIVVGVGYPKDLRAR